VSIRCVANGAVAVRYAHSKLSYRLKLPDHGVALSFVIWGIKQDRIAHKKSNGLRTSVILMVSQHVLLEFNLTE